MIFTDQNFQNEVEQSRGLVLVDFYADWCGPCKLMGPVIEELVEDYKGKEGIKIVKLNVDESSVTAQKYNIMSIPTLILFKDGKQAEQLVGHKSKEELKEIIDKNL